MGAAIAGAFGVGGWLFGLVVGGVAGLIASAGVALAGFGVWQGSNPDLGTSLWIGFMVLYTPVVMVPALMGIIGAALGTGMFLVVSGTVDGWWGGSVMAALMAGIPVPILVAATCFLPLIVGMALVVAPKGPPLDPLLGFLYMWLLFGPLLGLGVSAIGTCAWQPLGFLGARLATEKLVEEPTRAGVERSKP